MTNLLLDTHIWVRTILKNQEIPKRMVQIVREHSANNTLCISAISVWEVAMLVRKNRLFLHTDIKSWIEKALAMPGLNSIPITPEIALESEQLPSSFQGDPSDRFIVATARIHKAALVTMDKKIIAYAKQGYIEVIA